MRYIVSLILIASCETRVAACTDALEAEQYNSNRISGIERSVVSLSGACEQARQASSRMSCPICVDRTPEIQAALLRASDSTRQLEYIRAGIRHAVETWKSPSGTYEDAVIELQNLESE